MIDRKITLPDMILFAGTRVALGVGIGMLVSKSLTNDTRKATGLALTAGLYYYPFDHGADRFKGRLAN